ncbi:metal-dependent transcriptional regulator, partial [Candidatus Aerophobetes bacterium]|nr:metal-dependent transcriptional regulator [Candidatus Aerophobetes bacterium]
MSKKITPSMEAYLETIKKIEEEKKVVRVKGIARRLNVKMPTVTEALRNLSSEGLVKYEKYGHVELTPKGDKIAKEIDFRHRILFSFFTEVLRINADRADEDACKIEHVISDI